jgi:hypothetical protein
VAVAAQRSEDDLGLARLGAVAGLADGRRDRVRRLRGRDDALGTGEADAGLEALGLADRLGLDQAQLVDVAEQRRHAVVAQPAGVDGVRDEVVAQRVHLHHRREARGVAVVVAVLALGQAGAGRRLHAPDDRVDPAGQLLAQERERQPAEVGPAAGASHDDVRGVTDHGQLGERLLADDGLVQQDVVEHAAQGVVGVLGLGGHLHRLADRDAQAARAVRVLGQHRPARLRQRRRAGMDRRTPGLHHRPPVGLLPVRGRDHPDLAVQLELAAGERQRTAPLPGAGLGGQPPHAFHGVVVRLRDGRVGLVRSRRAHALVLVVDPRGRPQRLLQPVCPVQRRRPPQPVDLLDRRRNLDVPLLRHLLADERHREERGEVVRPDRLVRRGVQRRRRRRGQVGHEVVPPRRHRCLVQQDLGPLRHGAP